VIAIVGSHPAVCEIRLVGSRADGLATERSDWDFRVGVSDFSAVAEALPRILVPLDPLAQQWDRLSLHQCWMLMLRGPVKVDLIFPEEPHTLEPPWQASADTLEGIDVHFWDWTLWLSSKAAAGRREVVSAELEKLFVHLLEPLGINRRPSSIAEAVAEYRGGRARAERALGTKVPRQLEQEVAPALWALSP
jgi:hypothetical protein